MMKRLESFRSLEAFQKKAIFRAVKCLDIAFITFIYFGFAYIIGYYLDVFFIRIFGTEYDKKKNIYLILEVIIQVATVGMICYLVRNIVHIIPSPFDGIYGINHLQVKELTDVSFFTVFIMMFQYDLQDKLVAIRKNLVRQKNDNDIKN